MLDINYIRENSEIVKKACVDKQMDSQLVTDLLQIDSERKPALQKVETLRGQINANADEIKKAVQNGGKPDANLVANGKKLKEELKIAEESFKVLDEKWQALQYQIPNVPAADVPIAADESGNEVIRQVGEPTQFDFEAADHATLMENLDWLDTKNAVRIGGFRTYFLKNDAVILEQAVLNYALKLMTKAGFTPLTAPVLLNEAALLGTGYLPWGSEDHYYTQDGQILAGTAEVALTAYYGEQILNEKDLPIKMVGISPCFRREVGTYGKDTRGIVRVHQFNKVEQVVYTVADEEVTRDWHEKMLGFSEQLLQDLEIPYQVLLMCSGDMGAGQRKKYDLESWFPGQNKYRETHSASYFNDFQARRLNIKYRASDGTTKYVYTLNNTVAASPRLLACIIENHQTAEGRVRVPKVLRDFVGKEIF